MHEAVEGNGAGTRTAQGYQRVLKYKYLKNLNKPCKSSTVDFKTQQGLQCTFEKELYAHNIHECVAEHKPNITLLNKAAKLIWSLQRRNFTVEY